MASLPRSAWTSTAPAGASLATAAVQGLTPHWPGSTGRYLGLSRAQVAAALRGWRDFHVRVRGWVDIGYNFAVDGNGDDWELRGLRVGAHAGAAHNRTWIGVLFILGIGETPNAKMLAAFRRLRARLLKQFPNAVLVVDHGSLPGTSTACAGPGVRSANRRGDLTSGASGPVSSSPSSSTSGVLGMTDLKTMVRNTPIDLKANTRRIIPLHNTSNGPHSILTTDRLYSLTAQFAITGLEAGREVQVWRVLTDGNSQRVLARSRAHEIIGTGGSTFGQFCEVGRVGAGRRLRLEVLAFQDGVSLNAVRTHCLYGERLS